MTKYMKVFNGITALCMIYAIWGNTYFLSWFGVYDNPQDISRLRNQWIFTLVPAAYLTVPLLFFVQGFVSTFGLLQNKPDGEGVTIKESLYFIIKKALRLTPFNLFMIWNAVGAGPGAGHGPFWNLYLEAFRGCNIRPEYQNPGGIGGWWTNIAFINNLYPASFDQKCMGWSWFIPCYMQLTILLPFILLINRLPGKVSTMLYATLFVVFFALNAALLARSTSGIFLTFTDDYYFSYDFLNNSFMTPWFHVNSYMWGAVLCLAFLRYTRDVSNNVNKDEQAISTRFFTQLRNSGKTRYALYFVSFVSNLLIVFGLHGYIANNSWGPGLQAVYGALAYPGFAISCSIVLISAILGRAEFVRFFFGGEFWTLWRSIAYGLHMFAPIYCMTYILGMSTTQHLDYQMMFYTFCGTLVFSLIFMMIYFVFVDRPFHAMFLFYHDLRTVTNNLNVNPQGTVNIQHYKVGAEGDRLLYEDPAVTGIIGDNKGIQDKSTTLFDISGQESPRQPQRETSNYLPKVV